MSLLTRERLAEHLLVRVQTLDAIAALEKGLALEPDNALFRENLKQLQRAPAR